MAETKDLFDSDGQAIRHQENKILLGGRWLAVAIGIPGLTLVILALQTFVIKRQADIMVQQTSLMKRASDLSEQQHQLASRPNVVTSFLPSAPGMHTLKIKNLGAYDIRDVRFRLMHFKKFVGLGWQDSISSDGLLSPNISAGAEAEVTNIDRWFTGYSIRDRAGRELPSVPLADFYVLSFVFQRQVDDKRYLYLKPFELTFGPAEFSQDQMATSGPVVKSCAPETYAIELASEFYRRNPLPYPAELYNYHYLLGNPHDSPCLKSGSKALGW